MKRKWELTELGYGALIVLAGLWFAGGIAFIGIHHAHDSFVWDTPGVIGFCTWLSPAAFGVIFTGIRAWIRAGCPGVVRRTLVPIHDDLREIDK